MNPLARLNSEFAEPRPTWVAHWEHFIHASGMGVRGYGRTLDETFAQAALATTALIVEPHRIAARGALNLECRAPDASRLLINWLHMLGAEIAGRKHVFCAFDVHITGQHLHAIAWGEPLVVVRHSPAANLDAAIFMAARVVRDGSDGWMAECAVEF